jgi:hypothetical protein
MSDLLLESVLVCPVCGFAKRETMPLTPANSSTSALAATVLRPKTGDCCVFCSYGSVKCPPNAGRELAVLNTSAIHFSARNETKPL